MASSAGSEKPRINLLSPNDVLLGRGLGSSKFEGTNRFRDEICAARKAEYNATDSYNEKAKIAREVFDVVKSRGGRFLKLVKSNGPAPRAVVNTGVWQEVDKKTALEKCKQTLREKTVTSSERSEEARQESIGRSIAGGGNVDASTSKYPSQAGSSDYSRIAYSHPTRALETSVSNSPSAAAVLPDSLVGRCGASPAVDPCLLLFQHPLSNSQRQQHKTTNDLINQDHLTHENQVQEATCARQVSFGTHTSESEDEQEAALALAALVVSDRPKFTLEQEIKEKTSMTDQERASALCDLFGGRCPIVGVHQQKRARQDLDHESVQFLIGQMRLEIDRLPAKNKHAFMEAQAKCRADEFSDKRLERFLRVEGMNTKTAAQRFVYYWQCRRELFGPDKFTLRMTLGGALRDDITALETGVYCLLPHLDAFGRQLVLLEPRRNTGDGYAPESLLRAMWYIAEVASQSCTDVRSGFVYIGWMKGSSVFDFGAKVFGMLSHYETNCWPVKFVAAHMFGASNVLSRIVTPVIKAVMDRRGRSRMLIHDAAETDIPTVLSEYGIQKRMLPTFMQGEIEVNQADWIASRLAEEMEEIH